MLGEGLVERVQVVRRPGRVTHEQVQEPGQTETEEGQKVFAFSALMKKLRKIKETLKSKKSANFFLKKMLS